MASKRRPTFVDRYSVRKLSEINEEINSSQSESSTPLIEENTDFTSIVRKTSHSKTQPPKFEESHENPNLQYINKRQLIAIEEEMKYLEIDRSNSILSIESWDSETNTGDLDGHDYNLYSQDSDYLIQLEKLAKNTKDEVKKEDENKREYAP